MQRLEDMPLNDAEVERVRFWEEKGNHEQASRERLEYQKRRYFEFVLDSERVRSSSRNCYSEGVTKYVRKDGSPITEEDIRAVDLHRIGQGHSVRGKPGDMEILHHWYCDSSD
jgi:hypothetical protein